MFCIERASFLYQLLNVQLGFLCGVGCGVVAAVLLTRRSRA